MLRNDTGWAVCICALTAITTTTQAHDGDGHALVCSWFTNNVNQYDALSGDFQLTLVNAGGLLRPHTLTLGPNGNLFATSNSSNQVREYTLDGAFVGNFVGGGNGLNGPTSANWGPDGRLYVTSYNTNSVLRYNGTTGAFISTAVQPASGGLSGAEHVLFHPGGDLLVVSGLTDSVKRYSAFDGAYLGDFVTTGSGGIDDPHYAIYGPDGHLYVSAFGTHKVVKYDGQTGLFLDHFVQDDPLTPGIDESGGLTAAHGLRFGPDDHLFVTSFSTNEVLKYDGSTGAFLGQYVLPGNGISGPTDIIFLPEPAIPGDLDDDGDVDVNDLLTLLGSWGPCPRCDADLDGDGDVDVNDLLTLLGNWG